MRAILWRRSFRSLSTGPYFEDSVDRVVNILQDIFTLLLTHHHYLIRILSSFFDTASGGVLTNKDDDDLTGSTNTGSTGSLAELAINQLQAN